MKVPLSESELEFLVKVRHHVQKLFLVVNKINLVPAAEAQTIVRYVREQTRGRQRGAERRVRHLSAPALTARITADRALTESGLPAMEQPLVRFLTDEKSRVFCSRPATVRSGCWLASRPILSWPASRRHRTPARATTPARPSARASAS